MDLGWKTTTHQFKQRGNDMLHELSMRTTTMTANHQRCYLRYCQHLDYHYHRRINDLESVTFTTVDWRVTFIHNQTARHSTPSLHRCDKKSRGLCRGQIRMQPRKSKNDKKCGNKKTNLIHMQRRAPAPRGRGHAPAERHIAVILERWLQPRPRQPPLAARRTP